MWWVGQSRWTSGPISVVYQQDSVVCIIIQGDDVFLRGRFESLEDFAALLRLLVFQTSGIDISFPLADDAVCDGGSIPVDLRARLRFSGKFKFTGRDDWLGIEWQ